MASALDTGCGTVRQLTGTCDWCGHECHPDAEICVALSCQRCDSKLYHQGCVEKYLKKIGLAATRKIGFPCPFGKGKVTQEECKGRVEKAHPIVPKNEKKKQQRLAPQMLEAMAKQPKAPKPPAPAAPKAAAAGKAPARKMNPPKLHTLHTAARSLVSPSAATNSGAGPSGVWGSKGAAPVFANAHLPAPPDDDAAADADSLSGAAGGGGPRPAQLPVGLVLEEALTKAQKKNLARKKKRAAAGGLESASQTSEDHQELIAAAMQEMQQAAAGGRGVGAGGSGSSASSTTGSTATGLMGFDGAAVMGSSQHDVLAQQGHRFITDASQYAALLGLYMGDDSDEEEEGGEYKEEGSETEVQQEQGSYDFNEAPAAVVSASTPTPVIIDYNNNSNNLAGYVAPDAHAVEPPSMAVAAGKDDGVSEASAFDAAVAASIQQYQLEEEMRKQREALTHGFGSGGGSGSGGFGASKPSFMQAPVVAPVAAPVVAPVVAPSTPSVLFPQTKQQPEVVASTPANNSNWVFGGAGGGATALPPHIPAAYAAQYPTAASGGATMAAGHTGQEASAADDDDDDDLGTLLALCGVAC